MTGETMNDTEQALTEAVAKALYEYDANRDSHRIPFMPWDAQASPRMDELRREFRMQAHVAIAAVRAHDEQAALNCGEKPRTQTRSPVHVRSRSETMDETERQALVERGKWKAVYDAMVYAIAGPVQRRFDMSHQMDAEDNDVWIAAMQGAIAEAERQGLLAASAAPKQLSVEYACGSQEYWDLEPDGSLRIDIPHDRVVVSSTDLADAPGLDELLDSVGASGEFFKLASGKWCVPLWTASEITDKTIGTYGSHERNDIVGVGDTFTEALRNAVAQATTTQEGTSE